MEDEQRYPQVGYLSPRCVDHFYTLKPERTPGQVIGLTDWSEPPVLGYLVGKTSTTNSFKWATDDTVQRPYGIGTNVFKWNNARQYEFAALISTNQFARNTNMASMFYALGHVLHLNQDLTSPDHVRDAGHFDTAYFEKYGDANCTNNPQWFAPPTNHGWAYWQGQGFSQLLDFWDRGLYSNSSSLFLNAEAGGKAKLGLAEFSNGNFLGETALYKECYSSSDKHYFPFPSLFSSTSYPVNKDIASYLDSHLRTNFLSDGGVNPKGSLVPRVYVDKTGDGITFTNHSVLSYLGVAYALRGSPPRLAKPVPALNQVSVSIHDNNVLQAYHDWLIPKTVEYSTGILDYYFRGAFSTTISWGASSLQYTNRIVNLSGQDFNGGSFFVLEEDTNGVRTNVQQTTLASLGSGTLSNNSAVNVTFPGPAPANTKFITVYQGTIGVDGSQQPLDPVDAGIAIAVGMSSNTVWHSSFEGGVNSEPGAGQYFAEGWHVDSGSVDLAVNGIWGQQAYEGDFLLDLDGINPGTISTNIPTAVGQTYRLSFVYSRNPDGINGISGVGSPNTPSAQILIDGNPLGTLDGDIGNSWSDLQWQQAFYTFTATSTSTTLTFESLDTDSPTRLTSNGWPRAISTCCQAARWRPLLKSTRIGAR
jgi:hypothetical protein